MNSRNFVMCSHLAENLIINLTYSIDLRAAMTCTYYMYSALCIHRTDALIFIRLAVPALVFFAKSYLLFLIACLITDDGQLQIS